jgi:hypothetical protein
MPILYDERKKERRRKKKKKTSNYVNERTPFLFFSSFFTLVSDVFEKKSAKKSNTWRYVETKKNESQTFNSDITYQIFIYT